MSIKLIKSSLNGYDCYSLVDAPSGSFFSFLPELGCCLNELELSGKKILRNIDPDNFDEMVHQSYNGAQLFPFPNRLAKGSYLWKGMNYSFDLNDQGRPNALHGILTRKKFEIMESQEMGRVSAKYSYRHDDTGYPFDLDIINDFVLGENFLEIGTRISNVGGETAPVAHGWHPYFNGLDSVNKCSLLLPDVDQLQLDASLIPTGESKRFDDFADRKLIGGAEFDSCFYVGAGDLEFENSKENFRLQLSSSQYPFMQVFIPPTRDCIAIEPQTCAPDAFNNLNGLIELQAGRDAEFSFKIQLSE